MVFQFNFVSTDRIVECVEKDHLDFHHVGILVGFVKNAPQEPTIIYIGQAVVVDGSAVGSQELVLPLDLNHLYFSVEEQWHSAAGWFQLLNQIYKVSS